MTVETKQWGARFHILKYALLTLGIFSFPTITNATDRVSCSLELLRDLGWQTSSLPDTTDTLYFDTCQHNLTPRFNTGASYSGTDNSRLISRISSAIQSTTSRCLFNRKLGRSVAEATTRIMSNNDFVFPKPGNDPRDPFTPPDSTWLPSKKRGYDIPSSSVTDGIRSLYKKPVVAECAAAIQVAQLATLVEHFGNETDSFVTPQEIGIGVWREFAKSPSIKANKSLLISRKQRKHALKRLATLGKGAFYNQSGYMSPVNDTLEFIDSLDNRGQNFLILDITDVAVEALKNRRRPLRELNRLTLEIWHNYSRLRATGLPIAIVEELLENELLAADTFFSDVTVYIHPLRTGTFAKFLARQFRYNPRTAYKFEIYEDFQSGYFFNSYVEHRLSMCK